MANADTRAFSDHLHKLMFIKRLQEREGLMHKHFDGPGLIPSGGGLDRGGGLPIGRGLDDGGFSKRKPAIKEQMLTEVKVSEDDVNDALADYHAVTIDLKDNIKKETKPAGKHGNKQRPTGNKVVTNDNNIRILGRTGSVFTRDQLEGVQNKAFHRYYEVSDQNERQKHEGYRDHNPINFTGQTTSKGIVFTKDSGEVLKFRSIAALSKASGLSKYKILGKFKPKKIGDKLRHDTLLGGGSIEFVGKQGLNAATV